MKTILQLYIILFISFACQTLFVSCTNKMAEEEQNAATSTTAHEEGTQDHHQEENKVELTPEQYRIAGVELGIVAQRSLSNTIAVNGLLDVPPQNMVSISVPLGGFVKSTELLQGMRIKKGQVIAVIENPEFITLQQDYLDSKSRLEYLELEYARQQELAAENVSAAKTLQQTTAEYKSMKSRVAGLKEKLSFIGIQATRLESGKISRTVAIYAPISGYVTEVNTNIGKYVNPTDVLFEIVDTEHLHVELTVFEKDITKLKKGQKIRYKLPNESNRERTATLYLIGREISPERTIRVHAHMDEEDTELIPGLYVQAYIETDNNRVAALPSDAIVQSEEKDYVFLYKGKRKEGKEEMTDFEMIRVERGVSEGGYTQVALSDDIDTDRSQIAVKGAFSLLAKLKNTEEEGEGHGH